jgi:hypothetical protein
MKSGSSASMRCDLAIDCAAAAADDDDDRLDDSDADSRDANEPLSFRPLPSAMLGSDERDTKTGLSLSCSDRDALVYDASSALFDSLFAGSEVRRVSRWASLVGAATPFVEFLAFD